MQIFPQVVIGQQRWLWVITVASVAVFLFSGCDRRSTSDTAAPTDPAQTADNAMAESADTAPPADPAPTADDDTLVTPDNVDQTRTVSTVEETDSGTQLYARHCAACHGERGDGQGVAAAYLFPKPRNFRAGRFKLVSTRNIVPTAEDLDALLLRGMPGSSMPPWPHLSKTQRDALAEQVIEFWREGLREREIQFLKEDEELSDEEIAEQEVQEEIEQFVLGKTTPGETTEVPAIATPDPQAVARGQEIYLQLSCHSCHGREGKGDAEQQMFDDEGYPTTARDYTAGVFKGGHDPASLYRRIAYGMPGTPMPSTPSSLASPAQIIDLVHFLRSLSDEGTRQSVIMNRAKLMAARVSALPEQPDAAIWDSAASQRLTMTPLWWRDDADPDLRVQALHDGESIAMRLRWRDVTGNAEAARSESFEDAAAIQLFVGEMEPFLGMGDETAPVDVWYWDADRQGAPKTMEEMYPRAVVDMYPFSETLVATAELDRAGARLIDQPDISLPARASGNQVVPSGTASGASALAMAGPGSTTFRLPTSQHVAAFGQWSDGEWLVVFRRPLVVVEGDGVSLQPGDRAAVAFAVWDGAHQDRDGKKMITIWQDLQLEP